MGDTLPLLRARGPERRRRLARKAVDDPVAQVDGPASVSSGCSLTQQLPGPRIEDQLVGRAWAGCVRDGDAEPGPAVMIAHGSQQLNARDQRGGLIERRADRGWSVGVVEIGLDGR